MNQSAIYQLSYLDIVTLKHIEEAEDHDEPVPPAFVDTLVRLSKAGFVQGGGGRVVKVTDAGHAFLHSDAGHGPQDTSPEKLRPAPVRAHAQAA